MRWLMPILLVSLVGCVHIQDETLYVADGLITMQIVDNKPKVRVATGLDECKWRARVQVHDLDADQQLWFRCRFPIP